MLALLAILAGLIAVDDAPRALEVELGKTVETPVGYARGFRCDDPAILEASVVTRSDTENVFVVKGVREGATRCRVGTALGHPGILFDVRVVAPKRERPRRR